MMRRLILFVPLGLCLPAAAQDNPDPIGPSQTSQTKPAPTPGRAIGHDEQQIEDIDLLSIEVPTVVTATRREQKITTVPYAVSVITAEDIRLCGARSIPDALRLVPGVDVADLASGQSAVSARGFHSGIATHMLVLVDGRQIFDSMFGGTIWGAWPFQLEDIERIEVIRGPGGVTWGANAVNGVINIISKDPASQQGLTITGGGGSRGSHKEHLGYAFQEGKLRLRVSGEYEANDGFRKGGSFLQKLEDDYKTGRMGVHAIYEASPNDRLTLSGGSGLVDGGYPRSPMSGIGSRRNPGSQASFVIGKWSHKIAPDNRLELTGYVNDFYTCPGQRAIDYRYQQLALQFGHTFQPTPEHTLTWGLDSRTDLVDASNADPTMLTKDFVATAIIGMYVQDQWRFAPQWALDLGARLDYEFYGGFQPSARTALSYELNEDARVYGAVSRAFHMSTAASRFLDIPLANGLAYMTSNRGFEADTLIAYEVGYHDQWFDHLDTNLGLFWHEYDNVLALKPKPGPPGLIQLSNDNSDRGGEASLYGLEWDAKYAVSKRLTLLGNYTFQQFDWRSPTNFMHTDKITPPEHKFMLGARYSVTDDLHLSSHLYYVDAVKAPNPSNPLATRHVHPYFRLDLRAECEFWKDRASIAVGARNLLDPDHYEGGSGFINDAQVPRMVYAEFRMVVK